MEDRIGVGGDSVRRRKGRCSVSKGMLCSTVEWRREATEDASRPSRPYCTHILDIVGLPHEVLNSPMGGMLRPLLEQMTTQASFFRRVYSFLLNHRFA